MKTAFEVEGLEVSSEACSGSIESLVVSVDGTVSKETEQSIQTLLASLTELTRVATQLVKLQCERLG